ncbi:MULTISPECIES: hypothetical protein [Cyanophyceae]|uniref:VMAP-C domain-containing protein n=1 Tax=Cyanophyceae TaxID=3028117 RepID=UPI00232AF4B2|nr:MULTISPECIES: hypothetical protein [Cyanophyceae]MDB9357035.1 hypothetical protein [Nodularia spumigena CS-587/03]MDB9338685.1 hypothetical protein [Nodularia spumigena CS-589/07]MDB9401841.1 hypothetical protein [Microcystis aeruginosa CS-567/02-A1]MDB9498589.1 hypothetical protein [Nodularia spumigena CS-336/02]MDB9534225.1 hypothetical protein [Nodularia spumigena CS-1038]
MGKSKVQQIKKKILQENLNNLEEKYKQVYQQLNNTLNDGDKDTLKRQLQAIEAEMTDVENELNSLTPSILIPQTLIQMLTSLDETEISSITKAYQASCPQGFIPQADTLEDILETLQDIPRGDSLFSPLDYFVSHLVLDSNIPQILTTNLDEWGRKNIRDYELLLTHTRQNFSKTQQLSDSYLLIKINPQKPKSKKFQISAWLIPNIQDYQPEINQGYEQLYVSNSSDYTFTLNQLPKILNSLLDQLDKYCLRNLTLEFFLPCELLSHPVDKFMKEEYGYLESIGKTYRLAVRASERLDKKYRSKYEIRWRDKWQELKSNCSDKFLISQNHNSEILRNLLDQAGGLICPKFTESIKIESIFTLLLITATPVAICVRQDHNNVETQDENLSDVLQCFMEIPETVRSIRLKALSSQNDHIGHHISLVWEDPERLTPDVDYFYSTPQFAS